MQDLAHKDLKQTVRSLCGVFYLIGVEIKALLSFIGQYKIYFFEAEIINNGFYIPIIVSSLQFALLIVFRDEAPKQLYESGSENEASTVIRKLYISKGDQDIELEKLYFVAKRKCIGFQDLLNKKYICIFMKALVLLFLESLFEYHLSNSYDKPNFSKFDYKVFISCFVIFNIPRLAFCPIALKSIIFIIIEMSMNTIFFIGLFVYILIDTINFVLIIIRYIELPTWYDKAYDILILCQYTISGMAAIPPLYAYSVQLLPEAGYSLVLPIHCLGGYLVNADLGYNIKGYTSLIRIGTTAFYYMVSISVI